MYYLQQRRKIINKKLVYFGLKIGKNPNAKAIKLTKRQIGIINSLPKELDAKEIKSVKKLIVNGDISKTPPATSPNSLKEATFCKSCCANDFIIPGIEFDERGLCPICASKESTANLKSVIPVTCEIKKSKKSRFDIALFYTGGKDSTFLLYYLAKVKNLRVLALTWVIPYASESALKSIENAKKHFKNVEFIQRSVCAEDLKKIYAELYRLNGNACACPSLAYALFYSTLVAEKVPYFTAGNEPAQMAGLYYNGMAPKIAYTFHENGFLNFLVNFGRILTLRPPLKRGQFHTLTTMSQLAFGTKKIVKLSGYENELVENVTQAIHTVPQIIKPLKSAVRHSSRSGNIPAFIQFDFDKICNGKYEWEKVKDIIKTECGWVAPEGNDKALHTSCKIERCKEHTQFKRFYNMQSKMIPFSAIELSIAVRDGNVPRDKALKELETRLGFTLDEPTECTIMKEFFK